MLSIVVPTYQESSNLPILISEIEEALTCVDHEVVIIDDESPDGTFEVAKKLGHQWGRIRAVQRRGKDGLASAVVEGFHLADGDVIAVMDADMQHPPAVLPSLFKELDSGADVVVASRYIDDESMARWLWWRRFVSYAARWLAYSFLPVTRVATDPLSGFFAVKRKVIDSVEFDCLGFKILLEILVKGRYSRVVEVPYVFGCRKNGDSKLNLTEYTNYIRSLERLSRNGGLHRKIKQSRSNE